MGGTKLAYFELQMLAAVPAAEWPQPRVRTHCPSQKATMAASVMAAKKVWADRS
jgi:hypothetical protein